MSNTTIQIPESLRDRLRDERLDHESNYAETIDRLLDGGSAGKLWSEGEIRDLVREMVVVKALE